MNILFIAPRLHSNQSDLIKKLNKEEHNLKFLVMGISQSEDHSVIKPIKIKNSVFNRLNFKNHNEKDFAKWAMSKIPSIFQIISEIISFKPDVIILRGATTPVYSKIVLPIAKIMNIKVVFYTQGPLYVSEISFLKKCYISFINLLNIKWYTTVLFNDNNIVGKKKVPYLTYIPFFKELKIDKVQIKKHETLKILCIGKYQFSKNIKLLLEVINELNNKNYNFELTVIGSTGNDLREKYFDEVNVYLKENNLIEKVNLLKNVPFEDIENYYQSHDIFILPSIKEPASISQIEAMSYGLPVICSSDNGTAHYVQNGINGFVIDMNFDNLYESILNYINEPDLLKKHSIMSIKVLSEDLNIEKSYKDFLELIQS